MSPHEEVVSRQLPYPSHNAMEVNTVNFYCMMIYLEEGACTHHPKSASLRSPLVPMTMFSGFKSRCITFFVCRCSNAEAICFTYYKTDIVSQYSSMVTFHYVSDIVYLSVLYNHIYQPLYLTKVFIS